MGRSTVWASQSFFEWWSGSLCQIGGFLGSDIRPAIRALQAPFFAQLRRIQLWQTDFHAAPDACNRAFELSEGSQKQPAT